MTWGRVAHNHEHGLLNGFAAYSAPCLTARLGRNVQGHSAQTLPRHGRAKLCPKAPNSLNRNDLLPLRGQVLSRVSLRYFLNRLLASEARQAGGESSSVGNLCTA